MISFVLAVVLCGLCSDVIASRETRTKREDPYAELITKVRHYLSLRQTGNAGSPSVIPNTTFTPHDGVNGVGTQLTSKSPPTTTNSPVGPTPSPSTWDKGNVSFSLDSHLYCPIVKDILARRVSNFPRINDMTDYITVHAEMYRPVVARTMRLLAFVKDPDVASLFLVRRLTQNIVEKRLTCSTAKYQQVVIYTITREAQSTMGNHILSDKLMTVLHGFSKSRNLTQRILNIVRSAVFNGILEWVINEEFWELDSLIERFYHFTERRFKEMKTTGMPSETWTEKFLQEMTPYMHNQRALQCTSLNKMKWNHARIAKQTRKAYGSLVVGAKFGWVRLNDRVIRVVLMPREMPRVRLMCRTSLP